MSVARRVSLCHWGAFEATVESGRLVSASPLPGSGADARMIGAWPALVHSDLRIGTPHARRRWLKHGFRAGGEGRGRDEMVPVSWDVALDLAAAELRRVRDTHGAASVFGGSYGWSSAGRFHHARTQLRRFLAAAGGFTDTVGNYSWGAAQAILPYVLGSHGAVSQDATDWRTIASDSDVVVAFGGLNAKNWRVTSGGAGAHAIPDLVAQAAAQGVRFVVIAPWADDLPPGVEADLIRPRPNSDTAIILALAHEALITGRADLEFLARYTEGAHTFCDYLRGASDGQPKTLDWAADIADVPTAALTRLWSTVRDGRVMLTASWSLQRADHGEQPYWALIALAAMLGQIGLPGGGFCFGYGSMNGVGAPGRRGFVPTMPSVANPQGGAIPVASFAEAFLSPGGKIDFDGRRVIFPDVRMVWWAGGNPFHHAQDLNRLERAWQRPETVIVNDPWWTATARRADIVLPATTSVERNDIGGSSRDLTIFYMPRLIAPIGDARDDFTIFQGIADRLDCRAAFDDGLDETAWLRRLWAMTQANGSRTGVQVPGFDTFSQAGFWPVPPQDRPEILLEAFRADPEAQPLATPSGRIELFSQTIAGFAYDDCPSHPTWIAPAEWLGSADHDELHLVTNQPARQLHSQLYQTRQPSGPEDLRIAPDDAAARGLKQGDRARIWNTRGACLGTVRIDAGLRPGVVVMATGAWFSPDGDGPERNGNANVLTADRQTSRLGQACAALSTLVRVDPAPKY